MDNQAKILMRADIPATYSPAQIGQHAKSVAPYRTSQEAPQDIRLKQFDTLRSLLQHIRNTPEDARSDLRIKGNALVAKCANGDYHHLIEGLRFSGDGKATDALSALGLYRPAKEAHGSLTERFRCALSHVGNRLIGRDASQARSEHLSLQAGALRRAVEARMRDLPVALSTIDRRTSLDSSFFRGKDADCLAGISLAGLPLHECNFQNADLNGQDLSGCSLPLKLTGADLRGTRLFGATFGQLSPLHTAVADSIQKRQFQQLGPNGLTQVYVDMERREGAIYPDFTGVELTGAQLTLPSPFDPAQQPQVWGGGGVMRMEDILDLSYNHRDQPISGSLLKTIHSIGDLPLKRQLMEESIANLMEKTNRSQRVAIRGSLTDILFHRDYFDDPAQASATSSVRKLKDELIKANFSAGKVQLPRYPYSSELKCSFLQEHVDHAQALVDRCTATGQTGLEEAPAALCQRLIQQCARTTGASAELADLQARALRLQQSIFRLPAYADTATKMCEVLGYDGVDSVELGGLALFEASNNHTVAMTGEYYQAFIQNLMPVEQDVVPVGIAPNPRMDIQVYKQGEQVYKQGEPVHRVRILPDSIETKSPDSSFFRGKGAAYLANISLVGLPLHECNFQKADLNGKNLSGCSLPLDLTGADLRGARLFGATFGRLSPLHTAAADRMADPMRTRGFQQLFPYDLTKVYIDMEGRVGAIYPDFTGVELTGAQLTLPSPFDSSTRMEDILDLNYNHLNNPTGSLLTTIHSIGDLPLKRQLMEENIAHLMEKTDRSQRAQISAALTDILFHRDYLDDPAQASATSSVRKLKDELIEANFSAGNINRLKYWKSSDPKSLFLQEHVDHAQALVDRCTATGQAGLAEAPAALCQQLIQECAHTTGISNELADDLQARALRLQQSIFRLPAYTDTATKMCEVLGYGGVDEVELGGLALFEASDNQTVAMTGDYYQAFIQGVVRDGIAPNPAIGIQVYKQGEPIHLAKMLSDGIETNTFLRKLLGPAFATGLVHHLGLELGPVYTRMFDQASLTGAWNGEKLLDIKHQERLGAIIAPHLIDESTRTRHVELNEDYVNGVLRSARMLMRSPVEQGCFLLCLSAMAALYSSKRFFGIGDDSPQALRDLSAGLLTSAARRLPDDDKWRIDNNRTVEEEFEDLHDRLLGNGAGFSRLETAFSCTEEAFRTMNRILRKMAESDKTLKAIYEQTLPASWR
jgi:uncharacterized protein YjbI with pentapeptide repeats